MKNRKLLIATTNEGKFKEIKDTLETLPFEFVSLKDVGITEEPEEPFDTVEFNAFTKAKYYGEKSGLLTLSDDVGLFIDAFDGWPGVKAARVAETSEERIRIVLDKMKGKENRKASMEAALVLYEPLEQLTFTAHGKVDLEISEQQSEGTEGFGYDSILFYPPAQRTFAQMTSQEKGGVSHRGKALDKMTHFLKKQYSAKHIVVPCGLIINNGKLYMQKRNDPHRTEFHGKWEFPGGSVEFKESIEENVVREVKEETGFDVELVKTLQHIQVESVEFPHFAYQVYLIPCVCKVVGGELNMRDQEVLESGWFELEDVLNHPLLGTNAEFYKKILDELKESVK